MLETANAWTLQHLPRLNTGILFQGAHYRTLIEAVRTQALPLLYAEPEAYSPRQAAQATVLLGMWGSACVRHAVEQRHTPAFDTTPVFDQLAIQGRPFRTYLGQVADRTGQGHPDRDTYVSYFHWNPPTIKVDFAGQHWHVPGVFADGQVRTHTGDPREVELLLFVKRAEAVELAANDLLEPLLTTEMPTQDTIERMTCAAGLLRVVHQLFADFTRAPAERRMSPEFFTDTWRQFTNHWEAGDFPPSGAADVEFIARDLIMGVDVPDYLSYIRRLFPALLPAGQQRLTRLIGATSLPNVVLARTGLDAQVLRDADRDKLAAVAAQHPQLAACYLLLAEHVRIATAHLNFARRFVFDLRRTRDDAGTPDTIVMSSRIGSTGIRESFMNELKNARRHHPLTAFERLPRNVLHTIVRAPEPRSPDDVVRTAR
ncbi:hypothetical protein STRCI_008141 [Streptomyces cinnabarinus]|uniref:Indoleamine 2,3-dioxygenase n=1 Tax=Streptomyces cinnabarinus TaxID=67287 RepID=A0ABY7KPQ2_9ACTN|nr:hypothetical protein [Streptomyces cinnabarinus]WAZ26552.1 hypothetical protein STRCI_008141 [Streptomyces cinnabarinus]